MCHGLQRHSKISVSIYGHIVLVLCRPKAVFQSVTAKVVNKPFITIIIIKFPNTMNNIYGDFAENHSSELFIRLKPQ